GGIAAQLGIDRGFVLDRGDAGDVALINRARPPVPGHTGEVQSSICVGQRRVVEIDVPRIRGFVELSLAHGDQNFGSRCALQAVCRLVWRLWLAAATLAATNVYCCVHVLSCGQKETRRSGLGKSTATRRGGGVVASRHLGVMTMEVDDG